MSNPNPPVLNHQQLPGFPNSNGTSPSHQMPPGTNQQPVQNVPSGFSSQQPPVLNHQMLPQGPGMTQTNSNPLFQNQNVKIPGLTQQFTRMGMGDQNGPIKSMQQQPGQATVLQQQKSGQGILTQPQPQQQSGQGIPSQQQQSGQGIPPQQQKSGPGSLLQQEPTGQGIPTQQQQSRQGTPQHQPGPVTSHNQQQQPSPSSLLQQQQPGQLIPSQQQQSGPGSLLQQQQPGQGSLLQQQQPGQGGLLQQQQAGQGSLLQQQQPGQSSLLQQQQPGQGSLLQQQQPGQGSLLQQQQPGQGIPAQQQQSGQGIPTQQQQPGPGSLLQQQQPAQGIPSQQHQSGQGIPPQQQPGQGIPSQQQQSGQGISTQQQQSGQSVPSQQQQPGQGIPSQQQPGQGIPTQQQQSGQGVPQQQQPGPGILQQQQPGQGIPPQQRQSGPGIPSLQQQQAGQSSLPQPQQTGQGVPPQQQPGQGIPTPHQQQQLSHGVPPPIQQPGQGVPPPHQPGLGIYQQQTGQGFPLQQQPSQGFPQQPQPGHGIPTSQQQPPSSSGNLLFQQPQTQQFQPSAGPGYRPPSQHQQPPAQDMFLPQQPQIQRPTPGPGAASFLSGPSMGGSQFNRTPVSGQNHVPTQGQIPTTGSGFQSYSSAPTAGPGMPPSQPGFRPPGQQQAPEGFPTQSQQQFQPPPGAGQIPGNFYPGPQVQQFGRPPGPGQPMQGPIQGMAPTGQGLGYQPGGGFPPHAPTAGHGMPGQQYPQTLPTGQGMPGQQFAQPPGAGQGMPGQQFAQTPGAGHGMPGHQFAQAPASQQAKKLDPDQMPSAIGVMQEDQQTRGSVFQTNQKGLLPPLVTTKFQVEDHGNASPRYVRSTMYSVPAQPDMLKQTAIPFALVVNPFESPARDEQPISCVDLGPMGPVRCIRCKAYMSPLMQFIDGGRRFQCLLCKATTEVPPEYFQHLDHTGQRIDKWERPELWKGTYEVVATIEYCRGNVLPKEPAFIFVIDVSYNNVKSGLVNLLCSHMKSLLESLPAHTPVGFITYNSKVHFYNIDPSLTQPQMVIVPDVADMFMPLLTGFLVPRADAIASIDILMDQIPALYGDTKETEAVLGPAIQAGMEALKASERVGKLLLFHSSLPTSDIAPGKLKNREADRKLLGTDKEKSVLTPQSTYYNNLGQDCVQSGVSVDLYLFNNSYIDVATIGQVARITGGSVNKYTYFQADIDGPRVIGEVTYHLGRAIGFDSVMRVRTSTGVRPTDFHGHFFMANTTDVEIAAIDSHKGIAIEIKHDDKLTDEDGVYIQIALLYTSIHGQRRLRIHNLALNTCLQMADLYRNCELDTIINFLAKQCISKSVESTPQAIKDGVINRCAQMLATYRKHCANPSMPGQLILPECLKLLPLYINCVLRSDAVSGNHEITPDDRSWLMYTVMTMGVGSSVHYFYPKLIPIAGSTASLDSAAPIRCSHDKLTDDGAFILENGIYIFMWIGAGVNPDWLQSIFGVSNLGQINVETITELPDHVNSDESLRLRAFIRQLRGERHRHMRLTIIRQRDKMEMVMNRFLVEDRGSDGQPSYVDFLCHMHKEIRTLLNQ